MALVDALAVPNPQVVDTFGQPGVDGECTHSHGLDLVAGRAQALPKKPNNNDNNNENNEMRKENQAHANQSAASIDRLY